MKTSSNVSALLLGAALAAGLGGCKKHPEDIPPAPVTTPATPTPTTSPATSPAVTPAAPPADTTKPPATGATPGTSGTSGTQGTSGEGQPSTSVPDKTDQKDMQRDRHPSY